jgi:hypothetical protein
VPDEVIEYETQIAAMHSLDPKNAERLWNLSLKLIS